MSDEQDNQPPVAPVGSEITLESLNAKLDYLLSFANAIYPKAGHRVMWQDKVSASGIDLNGTTATAPVMGFLLGCTFVPTSPTTGAVMMICRVEGKQLVTVLDSTKVRFIDE